MIFREILYWQMLRRNLHLDLPTLRRNQLKKLRRTLRYAYENVPLYHRKFKAAGLGADSISSFDDVGKIPITTKSEVQSSSLENLISGQFRLEELHFRSTSGSTGNPLKIAFNGNALDMESALWLMARSENGFKIRDRMSVICDPRVFPTRNKFLTDFGLLRRQYLSIFDTPEDQLSRLNEFKPKAIKGYPSSLSILADFMEEGVAVMKPSLIFTSAEALDGLTRKLLSRVFGAEIIDNYSSEEFSLMAWECREHSGYHMNMDALFMEFVANGESVAPGERGGILCTTLLNDAMPLIRYEIGDVGVPVDERCSCGRSLPLMKIVEGRTGDFLMSTSGRIITPIVFFPYPFENFEEIKQFKVIQERRDKLTIQVVLKDPGRDHSQIFESAEMNLKRLFGKDMEVRFKVTDAIARDPTGKLRKIVSKIPPQEYAWIHGH